MNRCPNSILPLFFLALFFSTRCSDSSNSEKETQPDGSTLEVDCTDPLGACYPPFVCRFGEVPSDGKACYSPPDDLPPCVGTPAGQKVPFQGFPPDPVVHWALKPGCLAVSYTGELTARYEDISSATQAWTDVSCSELCLDPPRLQETEPNLARGERRIHFRAGDTSSQDPNGFTRVNFELPTGRVYTAVITISDEKKDTLPRGALLKLLGLAIGLAPAAESVESVMAHNATSETLSENDRGALCKLYGAPSYCGD